MSVQNTVFIFIPDSLEKNNVGFLSGFAIKKDNKSEFYITNNKLSIDPTNCIGYCGMAIFERSETISKENWLHINYYNESLNINEVSCNNTKDLKTVFIFYDYFSFCNSEMVQLRLNSYGEHFANLSKALKESNDKESSAKYKIKFNILSSLINKFLKLLLVFISFILTILQTFLPLLQISSTLSLIESHFSTLQWILKSIEDERRINLKVGNVIVAKIIDVIIGILIINWFWENQIDLNSILNDSAKELITNLQQLLKFLMGSPVGLKLNHAFNNALGNFFLYHIALWRTFLDVTSPLMYTAFTVVTALATAGVSFQTALAADILTLATFHVYCIYVYAARLYGVQVHGLISLWRLFIGRKRNPLRNRVDSCQYSHHQLFVGTLAFTILLFLLPTTTLYYVVFTTLRLTLTASDGFLRKLRNAVLCLPVYVTCLWAIDSPRTRGTVYVEVTPSSKVTSSSEAHCSKALTMRATLRTDPWLSCIKSTRPPNNCGAPTTSDGLPWSTLLHSIAIGDLL